MTSLSIRGLCVRRGGLEVLRGLDLSVESGESVAVLGRSGSGKTTLLRTIVGFEEPWAGRVLLDSVDVTWTPTARRGISFVAQEPSLQPNLTLGDNVERPLQFAADRPPESRRRRVRDELRRFGLAGRADKPARQAAAGEQHSAATARGTIRDPAVLLMDEPVVALDAGARRATIRQLRLRHQATNSTMLVATNDWVLAAGLADRVGVLAGGKIIQIAPSIDLYDQPGSIEVAELTGQWPLNRLSGRIRRPPGLPTEIATPAGTVRTWRELPQRMVIVGIRPADLVLVAGDDDGELHGIAGFAAVLGRHSLVTVDADGLELRAMGPVPPPEPGDAVRLAWRRVHLFTLDGEAIAHLE